MVKHPTPQLLLGLLLFCATGLGLLGPRESRPSRSTLSWSALSWGPEGFPGVGWGMDGGGPSKNRMASVVQLSVRTLWTTLTVARPTNAPYKPPKARPLLERRPTIRSHQTSGVDPNMAPNWGPFVCFQCMEGTVGDGICSPTGILFPLSRGWMHVLCGEAWDALHYLPGHGQMGGIKKKKRSMRSSFGHSGLAPGLLRTPNKEMLRDQKPCATFASPPQHATPLCLPGKNYATRYYQRLSTTPSIKPPAIFTLSVTCTSLQALTLDQEDPPFTRVMPITTPGKLRESQQAPPGFFI